MRSGKSGKVLGSKLNTASKEMLENSVFNMFKKMKGDDREKNSHREERKENDLDMSPSSSSYSNHARATFALTEMSMCGLPTPTDDVSLRSSYFRYDEASSPFR